MDEVETMERALARVTRERDEARVLLREWAEVDVHNPTVARAPDAHTRGARR